MGGVMGSDHERGQRGVAMRGVRGGGGVAREEGCT